MTVAAVIAFVRLFFIGLHAIMAVIKFSLHSFHIITY